MNVNNHKIRAIVSYVLLYASNYTKIMQARVRLSCMWQEIKTKSKKYHRNNIIITQETQSLSMLLKHSQDSMGQLFKTSGCLS